MVCASARPAVYLPSVLLILGVFGAGLVAGFLNVMAGGGSLITLPILIFLGSTWTARHVPQHKMLHGLLVGIFVAIITTGLNAIGGITTLELVGSVLAIGAGWLGGVVGAGRKTEV